MILLGLLQAAAILTVLFSVATSFGFAHRIVELFSHFRLQYLAASSLLLIVFAVMRDPVYTILMLVTTVFNASFIVPWYFAVPTSAAGTRLKLLHANVYSHNDAYGRLLELVEAEKPDVIFLQEISPAWRNAMKELQNDYPFSYAEPRTDCFGIALFSRLPLDSLTHVDSPPLNYPTIVATLTANGQPLTLISTHPTTPVSGSRYAARNEQLASIADMVRQAHGAVVLSGDFNISLWDPQYRILKKSTGLRCVRRGFGVLPTWPTFMPFAMIPIDHALVSDEIRVVNTRTGSRIGSDHLPLIVEIAVGD